MLQRRQKLYGERSLIPSSDFLCYIIVNEISLDIAFSVGQHKPFDNVTLGSKKFTLA